MISHIDARLQAWGRWVQLDRGMGSKGLSASWGEPGGGGHHTSFVPVKNLECSRTHDWVRSLPQDDQVVLIEHYCTPRTAIQQAGKLHMSLRTLYRRLHDLHCDYAEAMRRARGVNTSPSAPARPYVASPRTMPKPAIPFVGPPAPKRRRRVAFG